MIQQLRSIHILRDYESVDEKSISWLLGQCPEKL